MGGVRSGTTLQCLGITAPQIGGAVLLSQSRMKKSWPAGRLPTVE